MNNQDTPVRILAYTYARNSMTCSHPRAVDWLIGALFMDSDGISRDWGYGATGEDTYQGQRMIFDLYD